MRTYMATRLQTLLQSVEDSRQKWMITGGATAYTSHLHGYGEDVMVSLDLPSMQQATSKK